MKPSSAAGRGCFHLQHTLFALITRPRCRDTICTLHRCHPVTPSDRNIPVTRTMTSSLSTERKETKNQPQQSHRVRSVSVSATQIMGTTYNMRHHCPMLPLRGEIKQCLTSNKQTYFTASKVLFPLEAVANKLKIHCKHRK